MAMRLRRSGFISEGGDEEWSENGERLKITASENRVGLEEVRLKRKPYLQATRDKRLHSTDCLLPIEDDANPPAARTGKAFLGRVEEGADSHSHSHEDNHDGAPRAGGRLIRLFLLEVEDQWFVFVERTIQAGEEAVVGRSYMQVVGEKMILECESVNPMPL